MRYFKTAVPKFRKLFNKDFAKTVSEGVFGGALATVATHPFEQSQIGTANLPKTIEIRDYSGKIIGSQKNPARYGTFKVPGTNKEYEYDKGNTMEHMMVRLPKGIAGWGAASIGKAMISRSKFFK